VAERAINSRANHRVRLCSRQKRIDDATTDRSAGGVGGEVFKKRRDNYYKWSKLNVQQGYRNDLLANQSEAEREKGYVISNRLLWVVVIIIGAFRVWPVDNHGHEQNLCLKRGKNFLVIHV